MRCPSCEAENLAKAQYCANCGVPLEVPGGRRQSIVYCTNCGTESSPGVMFCANCGASLQPRPAHGAVTQAAQAQVQVEYIGFWIRLVAQILDLIILGIGILILGVISSFVPFLGLLFIPLFFYWFYKEMKCQTPGRRLLGIRVVNESGDSISFWRGILREIIGKTVSGIFLYLGFILVAFDREKRGWHDKIAGTYVVRRG